MIHRRCKLTHAGTQKANTHMQGHRRRTFTHAGTQKGCIRTCRNAEGVRSHTQGRAHCTALLHSRVPLVSTKQTCPTCVIIIESVMEKLRPFTVFLNRYHSRAYYLGGSFAFVSYFRQFVHFIKSILDLHRVIIHGSSRKWPLLTLTSKLQVSSV